MSEWVCGTGLGNFPKPGDPDNNSVLYASPAFGGIDVSWTYPGLNPHAVAHVILFRSTSPDPSTMVQLAIVDGNFYFDRGESATPVTYYYWIRIVSINGTLGAPIGPASSTGRDTISETIESLTGKIDAGVLAQSLKGEIDRIQLNSLQITQEMIERARNDEALGVAFNQIQAFTEETKALVQTEALARAEADAAFVGVANTLHAAAEANEAAIQELSQVVVNVDQALATKITQTESRLGDNLAQVEQTMQSNVTQIDGQLKELGSLWTVKVGANGLVGGFGVYNDGKEVQAGFDVDTFWVGRTGANNKKPFIVKDSEVFIDEAAINSLTFNKLRSDDGSLLFKNGQLNAKYIQVDSLEIKNANIKGDLKSDNYVQGKSGWILKK